MLVLFNTKKNAFFFANKKKRLKIEVDICVQSKWYIFSFLPKKKKKKKWYIYSSPANNQHAFIFVVS